MTASDPAQVFLQEARELLDQLEQALLDLERTPGDHELIDTAFRALHTIKGSGAMFGFDTVAAFTHQFETAFDLVRKGQVTPTRELIAVALAAEDHIRRLIDHPEDKSGVAGEAILGGLRRCMEITTATASPGRRSLGRMARRAPKRTTDSSTWLADQLPAAGRRDGDGNQSAAVAGRTSLTW